MLDKFCDETEWLLDGDTANECDHMRIVALSDLLHRVNLTEKVCSLASCGTGCREREREREREGEREGGREGEGERGGERQEYMYIKSHQIKTINFTVITMPDNEILRPIINFHNVTKINFTTAPPNCSLGVHHTIHDGVATHNQICNLL